MTRTFFIAALVVYSSGLARAIDLRSPTIEDMMRLRSVEFSTAMSPDGRLVAYTVSQPDLRQDTFVEHIWVADLTGGKTMALTPGEGSFYAPQWSPDSSELACLGVATSGGNQLFVISRDGGKPVQITGISEVIDRIQFRAVTSHRFNTGIVA